MTRWRRLPVRMKGSFSVVAVDPETGCPAVGVYHDVPFAEYAGWNAVNPSLALEARVSMRAFRHAEQHQDSVDTAALAFGRATHVCVWEPDDFPLRYVLWDGGDRRGKVWKSFWAANVDKCILSAHDYREACNMRDSVREHPAARPLFTDQYETEVSIVWIDPSSGVLCKSRMDYLGDRIADLKTARSIQRRAISYAVSDYGYHVSMAARHDGMYRLGHGAIGPVFVFVCKQPPYEVVVQPFTDAALQRSIEIWHGLLTDIAEARATGHYRGFADEEVPFELPPWEMGKQDLGLTMDGEPLEI